MSATQIQLLIFCGALLFSWVQTAPITVDLTHSLNPRVVRYPIYKPFELTVKANGTGFTGGWLAYNDLAFAEHTSTHVDAPSHFASGPGIFHASTIPVERLVAPVSLINLAAKAEQDRNYRVTAKDITDWEETYGKIPKGAVVLFDFNWDRYWDSYEGIFGSSSNDTTTFQFPGLGFEAAKVLGEREVYGVGIDTPSLDYGPSQDFPVHYHLLPKNIYLIENVADMSALPPGGQGVTLTVGLIKTDAGTGGPSRLIATFESSPSLGHRLSASFILLAFSLCLAALQA